MATEDEKQEPTKDVEGESPDEIEEGDGVESDESNVSEEQSKEKQFEKRFPQFKGETPEEYATRLEDAYQKSTEEGKRLYEENAQLKEDRLFEMANDAPEDETFGDRYARSEIRRRNREAFDNFVEQHPEINTDPALAQRLKQKVSVLARAAVEEDEVPDMGELLRGAYAMIGSNSSDIETRNAVKERAGSSKTSGVKKREKGHQFSPDQIASAKKMYPQKSEKELVELLAKYQ